VDADAFDAFYRGSFPRVVGQVYAMCGDLAEAQDCTQEAFVRAWDRRRSLDQAHSPEAWVRTVAWRLAVSRWRRTKLSLRSTDRARGPRLTTPEPDIAHTALVAALRQISPDQRRAIVLHYLCDRSVAEIAEETGAPAGTVKARLSRGRTALASLLGDPLEEESNA
jgi:RNA polymerase sigma-70 factor (ECF subfamily)